MADDGDGRYSNTSPQDAELATARYFTSVAAASQRQASRFLDARHAYISILRKRTAAARLGMPCRCRNSRQQLSLSPPMHIDIFARCLQASPLLDGDMLPAITRAFMFLTVIAFRLHIMTIDLASCVDCRRTRHMIFLA